MTLALVAPGTRKNNRYWLIYGRYDGRVREVSTKTTDKAQAKRILRDYERELARSEALPPKPGDAVTFADAARAYAAFRGLDLDNPQAQHGRRREDAVGINRLIGILGREPIGTITHAHLVAAANRLYQGKSAATKNREVLRPAAAILHYASEQGWCAWLRVKLYKEPKPATRAVATEAAATLIEAAPEGQRRLLLLWLFSQGTRISETLAVRWDNIDLAAATVRMHIAKTGEWRTFPLAAELVAALAAIPAAERHGRLFPTWTQKTAVYRWLRPLAAAAGVKFTPHMARHSLGTWLNASGAGLKTIMAALGHADVKSSARYQAADIELVRAATARLAPLQRRAS